jgi:UDP-N-acetylglucosamine--N-acetylmuramyl-(pentapeptide) pyrophosphoryl-undecaprenol N-acetylglucosamine transferase
LNAEKLSSLLLGMTRELCQKMAQAAYENGRREANEAIADVLENLAGSVKAA